MDLDRRLPAHGERATRRCAGSSGRSSFRSPTLVTLGFALALALGTWAVLRFTDLGKAMRATTEDAPIAAAFGVNEKLLGYARLGPGRARSPRSRAFASRSTTRSRRSQIYAWMGVVFAAVMMGGLGRPLGPLVAGIVIGVSEAITMAVTAPTWAPLVSFSLLIADPAAPAGEILHERSALGGLRGGALAQCRSSDCLRSTSRSSTCC